MVEDVGKSGLKSHLQPLRATGLVAFALEQLNTPDTQPALHRALGWLSTSQNKSDGRWPASSLNKHRELSSEAGLFMSDAST